MKTSIHPYLIARFMAVQAAFLQPRFHFRVATRKGAESAPPPALGNNWDTILKRDEDDEDGGGGGTIRGNRGKNAVHAAAALKRLTRGGRR